MTKQYYSITDQFTQIVTKLNGLVDKLGDLDLLETLQKDDLVASLNEVTQLTNDLDSDVGLRASLVTTNKQNLVAAINEVDGFAKNSVQLAGNQNISGIKTFSSKASFRNNISLDAFTKSSLDIFAHQRTQSKGFRLSYDLNGAAFENIDSSGSNAFKSIRVVSANQMPTSIEFYTNSNILAGVLDSDGTAIPTIKTILTRQKADVRYYVARDNVFITNNRVQSREFSGDSASGSMITNNVPNGAPFKIPNVDGIRQYLNPGKLMFWSVGAADFSTGSNLAPYIFDQVFVNLIGAIGFGPSGQFISPEFPVTSFNVPAGDWIIEGGVLQHRLNTDFANSVDFGSWLRNTTDGVDYPAATIRARYSGTYGPSGTLTRVVLNSTKNIRLVFYRSVQDTSIRPGPAQVQVNNSTTSLFNHYFKIYKVGA